MDSPVPPQYKQLVDVKKHTPSSREKAARDLSKTLSVNTLLSFAEELHFTDGVESLWQVSISEQGMS